jgi:hypothetical protein
MPGELSSKVLLEVTSSKPVASFSTPHAAGFAASTRGLSIHFRIRRQGAKTRNPIHLANPRVFDSYPKPLLPC